MYCTTQPAKATLLHRDVSRGISVGHECCERRMRRSSLLPVAAKLVARKKRLGDFFSKKKSPVATGLFVSESAALRVVWVRRLNPETSLSL
jgi:hypothetical protein